MFFIRMKSESLVHFKSISSQTEVQEQDVNLEEYISAVDDLIETRIHSYNSDLKSSLNEMVTNY